MTSGKDWQLPKQSWHTGYPSSLLQKLRATGSSQQGQALHEERNSTSWKRYLSTTCDIGVSFCLLEISSDLDWRGADGLVITLLSVLGEECWLSAATVLTSHQ